MTETGSKSTQWTVRFQVTAGGDSVRSRNEGGGGLKGERESNKVMVRHRERDNRECLGTAGPSEDQVK